MVPADHVDHNGDQAEDEEDFFGDQEEEDDSGLLSSNSTTTSMAKRESAAAARRFETAGYHEAYERSHDAALQAGFDAGYRESFDRSVAIGKCLGIHVGRAKWSSLFGSTGTGAGDDEKNSRRRYDYLEMASIIRSRLSTLTTPDGETSTIPPSSSSDALERLEVDVRRISEER
jgi:hypothetical protein